MRLIPNVHAGYANWPGLEAGEKNTKPRESLRTQTGEFRSIVFEVTQFLLGGRVRVSRCVDRLWVKHFCLHQYSGLMHGS